MDLQASREALSVLGSSITPCHPRLRRCDAVARIGHQEHFLVEWWAGAGNKAGLGGSGAEAGREQDGSAGQERGGSGTGGGRKRGGSRTGAGKQVSSGALSYPPCEGLGALSYSSVISFCSTGAAWWVSTNVGRGARVLCVCVCVCHFACPIWSSPCLHSSRCASG